MTFSPPSYVPPAAPEWATFIDGRHPQFKVHRTRAHAYAAVNIIFGYRRKRGGIVYRLVDGKWTEHEQVAQ